MLDGLQWKLWNAAGQWEPGNGWGCGIVSAHLSVSSCKGSYGNLSIWVRTSLNKQHKVHLKEEIQGSSRMVRMEIHPQNGVDFGLHTKCVNATQPWWYGQRSSMFIYLEKWPLSWPNFVWVTWPKPPNKKRVEWTSMLGSHLKPQWWILAENFGSHS